MMLIKKGGMRKRGLFTEGMDRLIVDGWRTRETVLLQFPRGPNEETLKLLLLMAVSERETLSKQKRNRNECVCLCVYVFSKVYCNAKKKVISCQAHVPC